MVMRTETGKDANCFAESAALTGMTESEVRELDDLARASKMGDITAAAGIKGLTPADKARLEELRGRYEEGVSKVLATIS